ncbi:MAG: 2-amino-4-hydroxy-6-hydroxymethyldihydropteridine diphosphokinase [Alloprevotella sp.]|nr:2-amino-4-hydroxy-6-hydroxymethyldihydropteridine diphosphokinase [Alloprevotella sp.]MBR1594961.1 2-amino-4-hydroxy-6-hydroxymethyldihydropteridine diphosphokinase [Alloprevotella sp.]
MPRIYLGLGANLGDREANIRNAVGMLEQRIGPLLRMSSLFETEPLGFRSEHPFLNAAAEFETALPPRDLLKETQAVERILGRKHKSHDGIYHDRPIDIDLLMLIRDGAQVSMCTPSLTLPHPRMWERPFVTEPLRELGVTAGTFPAAPPSQHFTLHVQTS